MVMEFKFNAETAPRTFSKKRGDNILFLLTAQDMLNYRLELERIISLNEILAYIGLSETGKEGDAIVWRYASGDIIDFDLFGGNPGMFDDDSDIVIRLEED